MKTLTVNGIQYQLEDKQDKHFNVNITEQTIAMYFNMRELPDHKKELWTEKQYINIAAIAYAKAQETGNSFRVQLHKTRWWALMNRPSTAVMYTNKLDDMQLGIIKYCLTHGINVALEDECSSIKRIMKPVVNLYTVDLFKKFVIDTLDISKLPTADRQEKAYKARQNLANARVLYMTPYWVKVNEMLQDITDFYKELKLESIGELRTWADRYRTAEILEAYGANITIYDLDKPEIMEAIIRELSIWAPAFEIDVKLNDSVPDSMTYTTRIELTPSYLVRETDTMVRTTTRTTKETLTQTAFMKKMLKIRQALKKDDLHKLIEAYIQIQFYKAHTDEFISDNYYVCQDCGHPTHKHADNCPFCGLPNDNTLPEVTLTSFMDSINDDAEYTKLMAAPRERQERDYSKRPVVMPEIAVNYKPVVTWMYAKKCSDCQADSCETCAIFNNIIGAGK